MHALDGFRRRGLIGCFTGVVCLTASWASAQGGYTPPPDEETSPSKEGSSPSDGEAAPPPEPAEEASAVPAAAGEDDSEVTEETEPTSPTEPSEQKETTGDLSVKSNVSLAAEEAQPSFKFHGVLAGAKAISGYQASEFGFGLGGLVGLEWGPTPAWGVQAQSGFVYLAGTSTEPPEGLAELNGGAGALLDVGLRIRPMASSEVAPHPGGPWLSGGLGVAFTARRLAPIFDLFLGYDFAVAENLGVGPTLGYMHIVETEQEGPRTDSANIVLLGVHGLFDFGVSQPKIEDRDFDGILDPVDKCPDQPEDKDGFEDEDGCPELDNDKDGIRDTDDKCPLDPEDPDEFEDEDGCPDPDNDNDTILDVDDECQLEPEDLDGFKDEDGCADLDNDLDGIVDIKDLCPNEPETRNGIADNDGCPDEESIRVVGDKIELDQKIHFWTNSDRIRGMSYPVLYKLADFLKSHPEYVQVDIEGHADSRGNEEFNLDLSKRRAASILRFLVKRGVAEERLRSEGFGSTRPLVEGKTEHAWFMNRRVEFIVTRNREVKIDPETGKPRSNPADDGPAFGKDKEAEEGAP